MSSDEDPVMTLPRFRWRCVTHLATAVCLLTIILAAAPAAAIDFPIYGENATSSTPEEPQNDDCATTAAGSACSCAPGNVGKPVSAASGKEWLQRTDMVVKGVYPIEIRRLYDSQSEYDSPLGYGWAFEHDLQLYEYPDPDGSVLVRMACGVRVRFEFTGGVYVPDGTRQEELIDNGDGTYTLLYPRGRKAFFDVEGKLSALETAQGNRLEFDYDPGGKKALTGTSPFAVDPAMPMTVAYPYHVTAIRERLASGDLTGREVTFAYDPDTGRVESVASHDGRMVEYHHEEMIVGQDTLTNGNLEEVAGLEGVTETYGYSDPHDSHNLTSIQVGQGTTAYVNAYDSSDRVISQTFGDREIVFDYATPLETTVTRTVRDAEANVTGTAVTTYEFDVGGYISKVIDALGNETIYTRESTRPYLDSIEIKENQGTPGSPVVVTQKVIDLTYGLEGYLENRSVTLGSGEVVTETWEYDQGWVKQHRITSSEPGSTVFQTDFTFVRDGPNPDDPIENVFEIVRRKDASTTETTTLQYDTNGQLKRATLPDGHELVWTYYTQADDSGPLIRNGLLRRVAHDAGSGELDELKTSYDYDLAGNLQTITDARSNATTLSWDDRGRIDTVQNALLEETVFTYGGPDPTPAGLHVVQLEVGKVSGQEGQVTKFVYDPEGDLAQIQRKDDQGAFVPFQTYTYDSDGNRLTATDAEGQIIRREFDLLNRRTAVEITAEPPPNPLNRTTFGYGATGNLTSVTDPIPFTRIFEYDELDRLIKVTEQDIDGTDGSGGQDAVTEFAYDAAGNVTEVLNARDFATTYEYNGLSQLLKVTRPDSPSTDVVTYRYDLRGRLEDVINARGQKIHYSYEPWGPVSTVEHFPDDVSTTADRTIAYSYDDAANLVTVSDDDVHAGVLYEAVSPDGGTTPPYDPLNRLNKLEIDYGIAGVVWELEYGYDRFGNRDALTLTDAGQNYVHSYTYDPDFDRLQEANLPGNPTAIQFDYRGNDDLETITWPSGLVTMYAYEEEGPLAAITVADGGNATHTLSYLERDAADRITELRESYDGDDYDYTYTYDNGGRLIQATYPAGLGLPGQEDFGYDLVGNREDPDPIGNPDVYDYNANDELLASPDKTYQYDADGNTTEIDDGSMAATLAWNHENRLLGYTKGATNAGYLYDPFGRRIKKTADGVETWFLWDGDHRLAEYDSTGGRTKRYAVAGSLAPIQLAQPDGGAGEDVFDVHVDHLETPRDVSDGEGGYAWRSAYEAYGRAYLASGSSVSVDVRFPGQHADAESGLHYNRFRYFDPVSGRYVSVDPLGQAEGVNVYAYVDAPTESFDFLGLGDLIQFPKDRARRPGRGIPRGPASVTDISKGNRIRFMDPKKIVRGTSRIVGGLAAVGAAGYASYCAATRGFCYLGQASLSPGECMRTFDPNGACCAIPGGGAECNDPLPGDGCNQAGEPDEPDPRAFQGR